MMIVEYYEDESGTIPFQIWLKSVSCRHAKSRILQELTKLENGLIGDPKSLGDGIFEKRLHFNGGYRIYYGYENRKMIIVLAGSDKSDQRRTIARAKKFWMEYKTQNNEQPLEQRSSIQ